MGPVFVKEPPNRVDFSNGTGAVVECQARGNPQPDIIWVRADGSAVGDVPGLRQVRVLFVCRNTPADRSREVTDLGDRFSLHLVFPYLHWLRRSAFDRLPYGQTVRIDRVAGRQP